MVINHLAQVRSLMIQKVLHSWFNFMPQRIDNAVVKLLRLGGGLCVRDDIINNDNLTYTVCTQIAISFGGKSGT